MNLQQVEALAQVLASSYEKTSMQGLIEKCFYAEKYFTLLTGSGGSFRKLFDIWFATREGRGKKILASEIMTELRGIEMIRRDAVRVRLNTLYSQKR